MRRALGKSNSGHVGQMAAGLTATVRFGDFSDMWDLVSHWVHGRFGINRIGGAKRIFPTSGA